MNIIVPIPDDTVMVNVTATCHMTENPYEIVGSISQYCGKQLQSMRVPQSEDREVRQAIGLIENEIRNAMFNSLEIKCHRLAIQALKAYLIKEPCENCKLYEERNQRIGPGEFKFIYCPDCSRKLVET